MKALILLLVVVCVGCASTPHWEAADKKPLIADPIVEKAVRERLKKPTGELTEADLEKVTRLFINDDQLTDVKGLEKLTQLTWLNLSDNKLTDVKGLKKLTKLKFLYLYRTPDLTKAQIAELQKALPKCSIFVSRRLR